MSSVGAPQPDDGTRRLSTYYVSALAAVAILSIVGQILVQSQLARQRHDSTIVNLAGRQRMLGQRVGKCAAILANANSEFDSARYFEELQTTLPVWRRNHTAMQQGDDELGLPGDNSSVVAARFDALNPTFDAVYAAADRLIQTATTSDLAAPAAMTAIRADAAIVLAHDADYLRGMDAIVSEYEAEAESRVTRLQSVERLLLMLTLVVLLLEGFFVFRPAVLRIRNSYAALRTAGEDLRRAKDAAEAANSAKSAFLANMSHEIRTPLHSVLGAAELIRRSAAPDVRREHLSIIEDSGRMLLCLLNDLLDLSKIDADKMELHPGVFDVRELIRSTAAMFSTTARDKQIDLRSTVADDVPPFVTADALRLRQVLANLLNNALKFTDAGSVTLHASAKCTSDKDPTRLRFEVADTGIGIPASELPRIFEAFTQVNEEDRSPRGGVGLGLDIASRLVGLMNGRFEVRSEPGLGSTFAFEIECPTGEGEGPVGAISSNIAMPACRPLRVLAAEDAPMIRRILEEMLRADGHVPQCVADGGEALAMFERQSFDLILLDLRMPAVDGLSAAAAIRESERVRSLPRTPIVALTAAAPPTFNSDASPCDFDGYLLKPFTGESLQQLIRRVVPQSIDPERASRIMARLQGRRALLDELVALFLQDAPQLLDEIRQAYEVDDRLRLKLVVHRLRGQLEMLEVGQAAQIARRLEHDCDQGETMRMKDDLLSLTTAWPDMCREVALLTAR